MANATVKTFVRMKDEFSFDELREAVRGLEGLVVAEGYKTPGAIVEIPEENVDILRDHSMISKVYVGKIPRSTVRGYDEGLKLLARVYHAGLRRPNESMTEEEAEQLREAVHRHHDGDDVVF